LAHRRTGIDIQLNQYVRSGGPKPTKLRTTATLLLSKIEERANGFNGVACR
jgi:hypothetical protein